MPLLLRPSSRLRTAAVLCALTALPVQATAAAAPKEPEFGVVTLGDGFIAGEGARWAGNATGLKNNGGIPKELRDRTDRVRTTGSTADQIYTPRDLLSDGKSPGCHRSDLAGIAVDSKDAPLALHNLACSGATTQDVLSGQFKEETPQLQRLKALAKKGSIKVVVISVGGNDVKYTQTMKACAEAWKHSKYCSTDTALTRPLNDSVEAVGDRVFKLVRKVQDVFRDSGTPPRVILQSYPMPLASGEPATTPQHDENSWDRWSTYGCPLYNKDLRWLSQEVGPAVTLGLKQAARKAGADFVDLTHLLDGHEVCAKGALQTDYAPKGGVFEPTAAKAEWARYLPRTKNTLPATEEQELLHLNAYGQRALRTCLSAVVSKLGSHAQGSAAQCRGAAGQSPDKITVRYTA
ncbi:GDSL-type esterase/lipase family protein [Streptomyces sp. NPDC052236]|uniref:GDSL-type esterase/lipase family protein n=1 Tax=Streptomyces sp. NPDC052236 TaxID=3365686 RepID=UPI0037CF6AD8